MRSARGVRLGITLVGMIALVAATAVGVSARGAKTDATVTVGFVYDSPHNDGGWSQGHDQARIAAEKALKGKVKTIYVESVPYGKQMTDVWNQFVAKGVKAIVDTSAAGKPFSDYCKAHPKLICATTYPKIGPQPKNQSNFYVAHWQGSYLAGVAAGMLSKKAVVGYVAPFKVPTVNASINSFALGCQSVKKNCTVKTVLTSSWYDPPKETEAAQTLVNGGVDIMYGLTDDPAYGTVAAKNDMWTIGSYTYANVAAGKWYVTGVKWDWTKIYTDFLRGVAAGTWKSRTYVTGLGVGSGLAGWGSDVPASVKSAVGKVQSKMKQGFNPFKGPIYDQSGKLKVAKGKALSDATLLNGWTWLVKGITSS
jgi:basic membrane lipoprotein Med (substrate-binding protein (PBP1-ABC) superfamily)